MMDEMELPNQEKFRTLEEKETYKYLGILEANTIKQVEMKKKCFRRTRRVIETKLYSRNLNKRINTRTVPLVRYSGPLPKWTKELQQMDQKTKKLMMMPKSLHPRDDTNRVSRKAGGRGLASIEESVDASIQQLKDHIEKRRGD